MSAALPYTHLAVNILWLRVCLKFKIISLDSFRSYTIMNIYWVPTTDPNLLACIIYVCSPVTLWHRVCYCCVLEMKRARPQHLSELLQVNKAVETAELGLERWADGIPKYSAHHGMHGMSLQCFSVASDEELLRGSSVAKHPYRWKGGSLHKTSNLVF